MLKAERKYKNIILRKVFRLSRGRLCAEIEPDLVDQVDIKYYMDRLRCVHTYYLREQLSIDQNVESDDDDDQTDGDYLVQPEESHTVQPADDLKLDDDIEVEFYVEHEEESDGNHNNIVQPDNKESDCNHNYEVQTSENNYLEGLGLLKLQELHNEIDALRDGELQNVVDIITENENYEVTSSTFNFDLTTLNKSTIDRIRKVIDLSSVKPVNIPETTVKIFLRNRSNQRNQTERTSGTDDQTDENLQQDNRRKKEAYDTERKIRRKEKKRKRKEKRRLRRERRRNSKEEKRRKDEEERKIKADQMRELKMQKIKEDQNKQQYLRAEKEKREKDLKKELKKLRKQKRQEKNIETDFEKRESKRERKRVRKLKKEERQQRREVEIQPYNSNCICPYGEHDPKRRKVRKIKKRGEEGEKAKQKQEAKKRRQDNWFISDEGRDKENKKAKNRFCISYKS